MPRPELRVVLGTLLLVFTLPALAAAQRDGSFDLAGIRGRARLSWPEHSTRGGYLPLFVDLENTRPDPVRVSLRAGSDGNVVLQAEKEVALQGHESLRLVLPVSPSQWWSSYSLRMQVEGESQSQWMEGVSYGNATPDVDTVLFVTERSPGLGTAEAWSGELDLFEVRNFNWRRTGVTRAASNLSAEIVPVHPDDLAPRPEYYTSLELVVVDTGMDPAPRQRWAPLWAWLRMGGRVLVVGDDPGPWLESFPDLIPWTEPRFELPLFAPDLECFHVGLGMLAVQSQRAAPFRDDVTFGAVKLMAGMPREIDLNPQRPWPVSIAGIEVPRRALTVVLLLFVFLIWPVNFYLVKRWGRPVLILVTVPVVAAVTSLGMLFYGAFAQGLDIKCASLTYSILDQRSHWATSAEYRQIFAGLRPGHGLLLQSGTVCLPAFESDSSFRTNRDTFLISLSEGMELTGAFLPARTPTNQLLWTDAAARQRLLVQTTAEGIQIENALGSDLERLLLRDPEGHYFATQRLATGGAAILEPVPAGALTQEWNTLLEEVGVCWSGPRSGDAALPPGCFAAHLDSCPWVDPTGLELNRLQDVATGDPGRVTAPLHTLVGVLPLDGEEWR